MQFLVHIVVEQSHGFIGDLHDLRLAKRGHWLELFDFAAGRLLDSKRFSIFDLT